MNKLIILTAFVFWSSLTGAQMVDVTYDYNGNGDCIFSANNNAFTPMFLYVNFADLQNTAFSEDLPYVKKLDPGYNSLFTLERYGNSGVPRFNYQIKTYRSNPIAIVDLSFPYLIPFEPGEIIQPKVIKNIAGFWGDKEPESWLGVGISSTPGKKVCASRQGTVVEIAGNKKEGEPKFWYHAWNNSITLLQPDGTLICYRNVVDKNERLELNQKIRAGEPLGVVAPGADEIVLLIYQNSLNSNDLRFILPEFVVGENEAEILNPAKSYSVVHPVSVRALEMTKKEKRKMLNRKD